MTAATPNPMLYVPQQQAPTQQHAPSAPTGAALQPLPPHQFVPAGAPVAFLMSDGSAQQLGWLNPVTSGPVAVINNVPTGPTTAVWGPADGAQPPPPASLPVPAAPSHEVLASPGKRGWQFPGPGSSLTSSPGSGPSDQVVMAGHAAPPPHHEDASVATTTPPPLVFRDTSGDWYPVKPDNRPMEFTPSGPQTPQAHTGPNTLPSAQLLMHESFDDRRDAPQSYHDHDKQSRRREGSSKKRASAGGGSGRGFWTPLLPTPEGPGSAHVPTAKHDDYSSTTPSKERCDSADVAGPATDDGPKQLIINFLAPSVTSADLHATFSAYGALDAARVIVDKANGASRQFGFVYFKQSADAARALQCLSGYPVHGRCIKVSYANPQRPFVAMSNIV